MDFVGISAYSPQRTDFGLSDLQATAVSFFNDMRLVGIALVSGRARLGTSSALTPPLPSPPISTSMTHIPCHFLTQGSWPPTLTNKNAIFCFLANRTYFLSIPHPPSLYSLGLSLSCPPAPHGAAGRHHEGARNRAPLHRVRPGWRDRSRHAESCNLRRRRCQHALLRHPGRIPPQLGPLAVPGSAAVHALVLCTHAAVAENGAASWLERLFPPLLHPPPPSPARQCLTCFCAVFHTLFHER